MNNRSTEKQVRYALFLMEKAGYPIDWMGARHKGLPGAVMNARSGKVRDWLVGLDRIAISKLITRLLQSLPEEEATEGEEEPWPN